jgi:hypothetical protein
MLGWRADCGSHGSHMMGTSAKAREATGSIPTYPVAMRTAHPAGPVASGQDQSGGQAASLFHLSSPN